MPNVPLLYRTGVRYSVPSPRGWRMRRWFAEAAAWGASNSRDGVRGDDAFVTVDALLGCGIDLGCFRRIDASLGVTNILDADYTPPGAVLPAPGVSLLASFGVKF